MYYKYTKHIITVIFLISVWLTGYAQELNYRIDKISVDNGLSNNTVRSITQDKQGFMWFGTESGLNRYDGSSFKIYYNNPNNANSLTTNMIQSVLNDTCGNLWIISSIAGINKFNIEYNQIKRYAYKYNVADTVNINIFKKASVIDKDNTLWFSYSNSGLYAVDLNTNKLTVYQHKKTDKNSISSNNILSLYIDKNGHVLIGTAEGVLNQFNKKTKTFTQYTIINKTETNKQNRFAIWEIFEDRSGLLWIGLGNALYTFNRKTKTAETILKSNTKNKYYFSYGFVSSIIQDRINNIWIATYNGLYRYSKDKARLINLHEQQNYKTVLTDKSVLFLYQDKTGIIWVGTLGDGIYKIHPSLKAFKTIKHEANNPYSISPSIIRSIYYDRKGYLWVGTIDDGISVLKNNKKIAHFIHTENNPYSLSSNAVTGIMQDSQNNYWISTGANGVSVLKNFDPNNPENAKFTYYLHNPNDTNSINNNNVTVVFEDSRKNIWIGTNEGLNLFNPKNKKIIHPKFNLKDSSSLVYIQSNGILEDKSGAIWVASWHGLYHFTYTFNLGKIRINNLVHFTSKSSTINTISDNRITSIIEDKNGIFWIGTYGGGLNKLTVSVNKNNGKKQYSFSNILMSDGLPSNEIYGMQLNNNNLWMSTNNGISKFNTKTQQITNYNTQDGLQSNIFFWGASYKSYTGELFFGGTNGLNYFFPDSIKKENVALGIFFTNFKVKNKVINPGIDSPLKKQINFAKEIVLKHSFETFTIEFTALNYGSSRKFKYKFKLEGYNKEWVETDDNNKIATYTNLNPGNYTFKVLALNTENAENQLSAEIQIKILSPFWQTWWFYSLEVLSAILFFFVFIKLREYKLKSNNQKLELIVEKRTLKVKEQHNEILAQNEEIKQHNEEMRSHNETLNKYKKQLEQLVEERTKSLQKALEKSTESERLKTAFLENLSHEIRTPLNAIVGFSQLLEDPDLLIEDQLTYINKIQFGSDSLLNIVDSIMLVSKMQVGEYILNKTKFALGEILLEQYATAKKALLAKKNKNVTVNLTTNKLENLIVYSDKNCISLILTGMIDNAIKFTEEGTIEIEVVKNTNNMIQFMIKDTGIGIHEKESAFIFDKFRKGENNKTKLYRGLGVGLALSKSLTDLLGGKIWVESEVTKGSTFYFTIPYRTKSD